MNRKLNLTRQFGLLSFFGILLIALLSGYSMSRFLTEKLLSREATLTTEFVESIVDTDEMWVHFQVDEVGAPPPEFEYFFRHLAHLPDVVHANVYTTDRNVLWASHSELIGQQFAHNAKLERALGGELSYQAGVTGVANGGAESQHMGEVTGGVHFVETYIPVWDQAHDHVVGVVELYKEPRVLHQSIVEAVRLVWVIALLSAGVLFLSLYWIFRRASHTIAEQHRRLVESESLSMIGETASAVAHAMRNPLASIRASAELTLSDDLNGARESARDIIGETDRLDRWTRDLLQFSRADGEVTGEIDVAEVLRKVIEEHRPMLERAAVIFSGDIDAAPMLVEADATPLGQVFSNLVVNAIEAMPEGGRLTLSAAPTGADGRQIKVSVSDTGAGLSDAMQGRLFKPFATTKPTGTGLGLALSKRLVRHYHGHLAIDSVPGHGLTATITLPRASTGIGTGSAQ